MIKNNLKKIPYRTMVPLNTKTLSGFTETSTFEHFTLLGNGLDVAIAIEYQTPRD